VLQKRIAQIQNDKTQAQSQLSDAKNKLDTVQKQLSTVNKVTSVLRLQVHNLAEYQHAAYEYSLSLAVKIRATEIND